LLENLRDTTASRRFAPHERSIVVTGAPVAGTRAGTARHFVLLALIAPLVLPPLIFAGVAWAAGMGFSGAWQALVEQSVSPRQNPLRSAPLGLLPACILLLALWLGHRSRRDSSSVRIAGWGGLIAILLVIVWANVEAWSGFLPSQIYPGFPHGLELVIGPLIFAPIAMLVGALVAVVVARIAG
jgi:hypothetical protein